MFRSVPVALALILATAATAPAANKDIQNLQAQITNLQGQIADLQRALEDNVQGLQRELKRLSDAVAEQNAAEKRSLQDRRLQDEALQSSIRDMSDRLSELREKFQAASAVAPPVAVTVPWVGDPATAPTTPAAPASGVPVPTPSPTTLPLPAPSAPPPRELYSQAYADFARGNFDLAIQGFQEYIKNYQTDFTDNAQYWIGECYYGKQQYQEAVDALNGLARDYPASDKLPDSHVKKGLALEKLGRRSEAIREYRIVIDRYPSAPAARIAREKLAAQ